MDFFEETCEELFWDDFCDEAFDELCEPLCDELCDVICGGFSEMLCSKPVGDSDLPVLSAAAFPQPVTVRRIASEVRKRLKNFFMIRLLLW